MSFTPVIPIAALGLCNRLNYAPRADRSGPTAQAAIRTDPRTELRYARLNTDLGDGGEHACGSAGAHGLVCT